MNSPSDPTSSPFERNAAIRSILEIEAALRDIERREQSLRRRGRRFFDFGSKVALYSIFGKGLTRAFGELMGSVKEGKRPYLGKELAKALDLASRKLIGYKRWLFVFGLLAATPGMISMILLWQQNLAVAKAKEDKLSDLDNSERVILLTTIYNTSDKTEGGMLTTPLASPANRRDAVLRLIERDARELERAEERDILNVNRMVDLSIAPLNGVDFSALPGKPSARFKDIGFVNSNFEDASFAGCFFEHVWFSAAYLWKTDFRNAQFADTAFDEANIRGADFSGAVFQDCDFTGAIFDSATIWPAGFSPVDFGATLAVE